MARLFSGGGYGLLPAWRGVAMVDYALADLAVDLDVVRLPGSQAVYVAVVHTEGCGDQDGVMNLLVGGALCSGALDVRSCDVLAALCTLPAIVSRAFSFSGTGAAPKSRLI